MAETVGTVKNNQAYTRFLEAVKQTEPNPEGSAGSGVQIKTTETKGGFEKELDLELFRKLQDIAPPEVRKTYEFHQVANEAEEKEKFLKSLSDGERYEPQFTYERSDTPSLKDTSLILHKLTSYREEIGQSTPLSRLYTRRSIGISRSVVVAATSQTEAFAQASKKMYGSITQKESEQIAAHIKSYFEDNSRPSQPLVDAKMMVTLLNEAITQLGLKTEVRTKSVDQMTANVSSASKTVSVREDYNKPLSVAVKQLVHEISHTITQTRGKSHPSKSGSLKTPQSLEIEEGVNVVLEQLLFLDLSQDLDLPMDFSDEREIVPEVRALAVFLAERNSFCDTFQALTDLGVDTDLAWNTTLRVKRGLPDVSQPGANHKDITYYRGLKQVMNELGKTDGDTDWLEILDRLSQGRFSLPESNYLEKMGIKNDTLPLKDAYAKIVEVAKEFVLTIKK